ncbi:MAG: endonuclease III domain-containing protein [Candidatus Brocadiaceae bacterium]|nr:endonuclease III domain-containing protein [Candidatus Brocadiaceae bacterium]
MRVYEALRDAFGHQGWWPAKTPFEVMVGAILTQRTNWNNARTAIERLGAADLLNAHALAEARPERLQELVRPSGYYRQKAARLQELARWLVNRADGDPSQVVGNTAELRTELLSLRGIGPETADSILLYALGRPTFVVDAYTVRMAVRHGLVDTDCDYFELQELFESHLPRDPELYKDYHAQLVELGKRYCRPRRACAECPLRALPGLPPPGEP